MRRLEGQHLALGGERALDLGEARACAHREHELLGLVRDDARVRRHVERIALARLAVEILAAAAADAQRLLARRMLAHAFAQPGDEGLGHQNRGMSGRGTCPPRTCVPPHSAQRLSEGTALPGFKIESGSKARFTSWKAAISGARNCTHICRSFSIPTPCSPVMVPPAATHSSRMRPPNSSPRSSSPALLAS